MSALSDRLEALRSEVYALQHTLAAEPHDTWMTLPHVAKLLGAITIDLERALDGDSTYSEEHNKAGDRGTPLEHRIDPHIWAYQWHGERVAVVAFTWEGGSDFDARGITSPSSTVESKPHAP